MEDNNQYYKPAPGIPEALHPEIGNSSAMETDKHAFVLRTPDPSKLLDTFLSMPELMVNETPVFENPDDLAIEPENLPPAPLEINEPLSIVKRPLGNSRTNEDIDMATPDESELSGKNEEEPLKTTKPKKKKVVKGLKSSPITMKSLDNPTPGEEKPQKAGKLLRKAAKSINKKEEGMKDEKPVEIVSPDVTLSPFTSWLKNLVGSEYVHPYEDDFALEQASGSGKEGMSETFADLLAAQGYKDQAREMYLRLMEKYPEKSSFFAAKIEALQ